MQTVIVSVAIGIAIMLVLTGAISLLSAILFFCFDGGRWKRGCLVGSLLTQVIAGISLVSNGITAGVPHGYLAAYNAALGFVLCIGSLAGYTLVLQIRNKAS
jgi:hypothetical protein